MKKILFVALGATLLAAGCQKTEIINPVNPNGAPAMTFTTGINKLTKSATASGEDNLQTQNFVLSAVNAYEDAPSGRHFNGYYDDLKNKQFTYSNDAWGIDGGDSYFWPGKDRDLVFFAISSNQKNEDNTQKYVVPTISDTGFRLVDTNGEITVENFVIDDYTVVTPTYTNGEVVGADDDLMVADVVKKNQDSQKNGGVKGQVDLAFNHTLSKVEFVFSTNPQTSATYPVVINSIAVNDVVNTADLNIGVKFTETDNVADNVYDWDATNDEATYATAVATETDGKTVNCVPYSITYDLPLTAAEQTYTTWLVIPQDLETKTVTINYTIKDAQNPTSKDKKFVSVWPLKVDNLVDAWEINHYVKYKVNLSPNMITFNPYLDKDWNEAVEVDPSTGGAATAVTYTSITVGEKVYYFVGTKLAKGLEVFELVDAKYVLTTVTSIETDACTYTLANGVVTDMVEKTV